MADPREREDDRDPVIWVRSEGVFVWQGLLHGDELFERWRLLGFAEGDEHQHIHQSGGLWTETFKHPGRRHMLRFDPNFALPCLCYCLLCGKRDLDPRMYA